MITTVTREIRGRKSPYTGQVPVRTVEYTQIEGVVTAIQEPTHSNVLIGGDRRYYTITDGDESVQVVHGVYSSYLADGNPDIQVGQRVRIIAETAVGGRYRLREVEIL
jgi:hypothetical protein